MAFFQWDFKTYSFAGPDTIGNALTWKQKTYKLKRYWLVTFSKLSHVFANAGFVEVFSNPIYGSRAFQFIYFIESTFSKWFHGSICVAAVIFARNFFINNILQWSINPINTIIFFFFPLFFFLHSINHLFRLHNDNCSEPSSVFVSM